MNRKIFIVVIVLALVGISQAVAEEASPCPAGDTRCLINVLKKNDDAKAMRAAMELGKLKSKDGVSPLIEKLKSKDEYMVTASAHALVEIGEIAVPELVKSAESKNAQVRRYTGYSLGRIGGGVAVKTLNNLTRDENPDVRKTAAEGLGKLGDKDGLFALVTLLQDRHRPIRLTAVRSLSVMPDEKLVLPLLDYALSDLDTEVSMEAAAVLIKIGPKAVPILITEITNRPPNTKKRMCAVLGELAAKADPGVKAETEKVLIRLAQSKAETQEVRQAACVGLGSAGGKTSIAVLQAIIAENKGNLQADALVKAARNALERLQSSK